MLTVKIVKYNIIMKFVLIKRAGQTGAIKTPNLKTLIFCHLLKPSTPSLSEAPMLTITFSPGMRAT